MEKYTINGVEVEYDTFDLENMERLETAVNNLKEDVDKLQARMNGGESSIKLLREQANLFLDFFDDVIGDGTAEKIFGNRVNILSIANGYKDFTDAVAGQQSNISGAIRNPKLNREQRRARR